MCGHSKRFVMSDVIRILSTEQLVCECSAAIAVPERALADPGHIRTFSATAASQSKHTVYALSRMMLIEFEDGELQPRRFQFDLTVTDGADPVRVDDGIVVARNLDGRLAVMSNAAKPLRKFIEVANRFCTRWIRLDI